MAAGAAVTALPLSGSRLAAGPPRSPALHGCVRRLRSLGAMAPPLGEEDAVDGRLVLHPAAGVTAGAVTCTLRPAPVGAADEEVIAQALSGLMAVNGRDAGRPRRLGLDVATAAAGSLATQGLLALLLGRRRGGRHSRVETSVLQGALLFLTHHLAMATSGDGWRPGPPPAGPGPPFPTADGVWCELEAPGEAAWLSFWSQLGIGASDAGAAWPVFVHRYNTAACRLPPAMQGATGRHPYARLKAVAGSSGVLLCRIRRYPEVLASPAAVPDAPGVPDTGGGGRQPSPVRAGEAALAAPLEGFRVLEISHGLPGPLAGRLLSMLGAEVTRVEPPGGDPSRSLRPRAGGVGAGFVAYNRGKRSVELNYKRRDGVDAILELASGSDVFLHNWPPGKAESLGLDAASLSALNPRLIHAGISGWGPAEGGEPRPGIEYFVQAVAGCGDGLNPIGEPAVPSRLILTGVMAALHAVEAVLAALCARELTGRGAPVSASMLEGAMALQAPVLEAIREGREEGRRCGRPCWGLLDRPLETAEGFLMLGAAGGDIRERLSRACGGPARATDAVLLDRLRTRRAVDWEPPLTAAGVPCVVVCPDPARLPGDPLLTAYIEDAGDCWTPAPPWRFLR